MAHRSVHCTLRTTAPADAVWAMAQDFCAPWHPLVVQMVREDAPEGQIIRRFTTHDDDTLMREQLTYLSHSDRTYCYSALEGIDGATRYDAQLSVHSTNDGTSLVWQAEIEASPDRVDAIATGTEHIFELGLQTLAAPKPVPQRAVPTPTPSKLEQVSIDGSPTLGLTMSQNGIQNDGTLVLFLHGIGGNRTNWNPQLHALGETFPMCAMDLRGYGDSTLGPEQSRLDDYFADIVRVMDRFDAHKVILCGLSYGAWIASSFALHHPQTVAGLVLCGGCTGMSEADAAERDAFLRARAAPLDAGQSPRDFAPQVVDVIAGPLANDNQRELLHASMASIPAPTYRDALNCFTNPPGKLDFGQTDFPILLMTGTHDRLAPPAEIRSVSQRFKQAGAPFVQFEEIANAGHVCNLEQPKEVSAHLARFLDRLFHDARAPENLKTTKKTLKRKRILDAALIEFSQNGYSGASMRAIANRANVSKPTLYHYIGQKDDVFRAIFDAGQAQILSAFRGATHREMADVLWDFSWTYADYLLQPENLAIARLMIGEATRVPDLVRDFHQTGPARVFAGIIDFLVERRKTGQLQFDDAEITAEHLWALILSGPRNAALHFPHALPNNAELLPIIAAGLRAFLRAYSADPIADLRALGHLIDRRSTKPH